MRAGGVGSRWGSTIVRAPLEADDAVEVRVSFLFTPDGSPPRPERRAVHVRLTDCTDPTHCTQTQRAPPWAQVVMNSVRAGTEPPSPNAHP